MALCRTSATVAPGDRRALLEPFAADGWLLMQPVPVDLSRLVARRPKYCAARVPIRVRTLTPAAITAATT